MRPFAQGFLYLKKVVNEGIMEASAANTWDNFEVNCLTEMYRKLDFRSLLNCRVVNKHWKDYADQPILWKILLCRDHAFKMDQLDNNCNDLKDLYKINWILKTNF